MVYSAASSALVLAWDSCGVRRGSCGRRAIWVKRFGDRSSERLLGLTAIIVIFPTEVGSRLAFYEETLFPD